MTDENTINWQLGIEHGCVYPAQYTQVGKKIVLKNMYERQIPSFYIKVKASFDENNDRNRSLMPNISDICNMGDYKITQKDDAFEIALSNNSNQERIETNSYPAWKCPLSMKKRRGIGLWVKGDNSAAVLVVCIPGGDYPVKIDFVGYRYIEIPDAQYSWRQNFWGWRVDTKHINYLGLVRKMQILVYNI